MSLNHMLYLSAGALLCYVFIRAEQAVLAYKHKQQFKVIHERYWPVSERHRELAKRYFEDEKKYP